MVLSAARVARAAFEEEFIFIFTESSEADCLFNCFNRDTPQKWPHKNSNFAAYDRAAAEI